MPTLKVIVPGVGARLVKNCVISLPCLREKQENLFIDIVSYLALLNLKVG